MKRDGHQGALLAISTGVFSLLTRIVPGAVTLLAGCYALSATQINGPAETTNFLLIIAACLVMFNCRIPIDAVLNKQDRWSYFFSVALFRTLVGFLWFLGVVALLNFAGQSISWLAILVWGLLACFSTALCLPATVWIALRFFHRRERVSVLFVAINESNIKLARTIRDDTWLAVNVHGFLEDRVAARVPPCPDFPLLGQFADVAEQVARLKVDRVFISLPMEAEMRVGPILEALEDTTASVYLVHDFANHKPIRARLEMLGGIPLFGVCEAPSVDAGWALKAIIDRTLAALMLIAVSPLLLATAIAIKWDSKGPVFFRQLRYGMSGQTFKIWKFRSMAASTSISGDTTQASKNDVRVTKVGKFIRRTSIDELPQLLNILAGQMSLVGPRPHAMAHNEQYRQLIRGYMVRHKVQPGLTGWAQVNGWRGETDTLDKMQKRVQFDLEYVRQWSVWFDFYILARTLMIVISTKNAY